ncbi:hypothetical protein [Ottowia sp.]|uniref:hypothetical protein n=1 Tax=Ottowia sp. TaxID=1898956 RepID=UPI003A862F5C
MSEGAKFRRDITQWLLHQGFLASNRTAPFSSEEGECFDRPSSRCPYLIECVDIDLCEQSGEDEASFYEVSLYLAVTSGYDAPAWLLRELPFALYETWPSLRLTDAPLARFGADDACKLAHSLSSAALPALSVWADLKRLYDFYRYIGAYSKPNDPANSDFLALNIRPSQKLLRFPQVIMALAGAMGNLPQAKRFLRACGVIEGEYRELNFEEIPLSAAELQELMLQGLTFADLSKTYARTVLRWTQVAQKDLSAGVFRLRTAEDVIKGSTLNYLDGYVLISANALNPPQAS